VPLLEATGVSKTYRTGAETVEALKHVDLSVPAGQFVAVMGPSGSGKTTLLNCLSGLDDIDEGKVFVDGESIHEMSDAKRTQHSTILLAAGPNEVVETGDLMPAILHPAANQRGPDEPAGACG